MTIIKELSSCLLTWCFCQDMMWNVQLCPTISCNKYKESFHKFPDLDQEHLHKLISSKLEWLPIFGKNKLKKKKNTNPLVICLEILLMLTNKPITPRHQIQHLTQAFLLEVSIELLVLTFHNWNTSNSTNMHLFTSWQNNLMQRRLDL